MGRAFLAARGSAEAGAQPGAPVLLAGAGSIPAPGAGHPASRQIGPGAAACRQFDSRRAPSGQFAVICHPARGSGQRPQKQLLQGCALSAASAARCPRVDAQMRQIQFAGWFGTARAVRGRLLAALGLCQSTGTIRPWLSCPPRAEVLSWGCGCCPPVAPSTASHSKPCSRAGAGTRLPSAQPLIWSVPAANAGEMEGSPRSQPSTPQQSAAVTPGIPHPGTPPEVSLLNYPGAETVRAALLSAPATP